MVTTINYFVLLTIVPISALVLFIGLNKKQLI